MFKVPKLEIHLAHKCNLNCEYCFHYSDFTEGIVTAEEIKNWIDGWKERLNPDRINLVGGEPFLNPQMEDIVRIARKAWPLHTMNLATNGLILAKSDVQYYLSFFKEQNVTLWISQYPENEKIIKKLQKMSKDIQVYKPKYWIKHYFIRDKKIYPAVSNAASAWEQCRGKDCLQLFEGKLWKCPPIAYLKLIKGLPEQWKTYLDYKPLSSTCSDQELEVFLAKKDELICEMCRTRDIFLL